MKKNKIRIVYLLLVVILLLLCGCNKNTKEEGQMYLYYINTSKNGFFSVEYNTSETNPLKIAKDMLHKMSDSTSINTDEYKIVIQEDVKINKVSLEDKIITVDFDTSYHQQSPENEILCRCAIVRTLMQIDKVDGVLFLVDGIQLTNNDNIAVGVMDEDSFMTSNKDVYNNSSEISLYYSNQKGNKLIEVIREVKSRDNETLEQAALEALLHAPNEKNVISPLPLDLKVQKVQIYNNICYVNLSSEIVNSLSSVNDQIMVYSMVNTIVGIGNATSVQFTVNGQKVKTIHEYDKFDELLTFNYTLCDDRN